MSCTWNEFILNPQMSINWRASLVPAAAVIPAPIAYIKVVAVKKLVVGSQFRTDGTPPGVYCRLPNAKARRLGRGALHRVSRAAGTFTLKKLGCSEQAKAPEYLCME